MAMRKKAKAITGKSALAKTEKPALFDRAKKEEVLSRPISSLKLPGIKPTAKKQVVSNLEKRKIRTLGDAVSKTEEQLGKVPGIGPKTLTAIKKGLKKEGLVLKAEELEVKDVIKMVNDAVKKHKICDSAELKEKNPKLHDGLVKAGLMEKVKFAKTA